MAVVSTVPGAISALAGYMQAVAAANPSLSIGVYPYGLPVASVTNNLIGLGDAESGSGAVATTISSDWAAIPAGAALIKEEYALIGVIRSTSGAGGQTGAQERTADAFTMWNGLLSQIVADPGGGGNLSPSGSWGAVEMTNHFSGPVGSSGWEVTLGFQVHVINAQLIG